eukprot:scaffold7684_cov119-Isochrysis_galbana.AAC.10
MAPAFCVVGTAFRTQSPSPVTRPSRYSICLQVLSHRVVGPRSQKKGAKIGEGSSAECQNGC